MSGAGGFGTFNKAALCPCCSGRSYESCCKPLHCGVRRAVTAEQLMRSRYSAFVLSEVDYLIATHPDPVTPSAKRRNGLLENCREARWLGLKILAVESGEVGDRKGTVRFEAWFRAGGQRHVMQELSLFQRRDGACDGDWLYIKALQSNLSMG